MSNIDLIYFNFTVVRPVLFDKCRKVFLRYVPIITVQLIVICRRDENTSKIVDYDMNECSSAVSHGTYWIV